MKFKIAQQGRFGKKSVLKSWKKSKIEKVAKNGSTRVKKGDIHLLLISSNFIYKHHNVRFWQKLTPYIYIDLNLIWDKFSFTLTSKGSTWMSPSLTRVGPFLATFSIFDFFQLFKTLFLPNRPCWAILNFIRFLICLVNFEVY